MAIFLFSSCQFTDLSEIKKPSEKLSDYVLAAKPEMKMISMKFAQTQESAEIYASRLNSIRSFQEQNQFLNDYQNYNPIKANEASIDEGIKVCQEGFKHFQKSVYIIGRHSYNNYKILDQALISDTAILFTLQYMKEFTEGCSAMLFQFMDKLSVEEFDNVQGIFSLREKLLGQFLGYAAIGRAILNDSQTVSKRLLHARENGTLSPELEEMIQEIAEASKDANSKMNSAARQIVDQDLPEDAQKMLAELNENQKIVFNGITLLFDRVNPDAPAVNALVFFANLTWGSIQSSLGLGIILTQALVVNPVYYIAELGMYGPRGARLRFLDLKPAVNGKQIYANVCGLPAFPSKMSMGIWELDFCTYDSYSSYHEGGHAKQSALLGPLYIPAAILSYLMNGGHGGFIESWADAWAS